MESMATALYRRYRPDDFADMIGQSQVTEPLMTALRTGRVNHAYLFSGPRGCGKTSSARILARCLNCAEGPTDKPCGVCPSCVELSTGGPGSLDVVEIDAASHGGVDDARDLRERALLAPSRDRYKVFIIDEAHMVTAAGFNALLKVVEEPPEHVRFVFATTEPEKVIGTIRSRTHHYPFRLIAPALMLEYVEGLCRSEHVEVDAGVLPLVVRAGGGSARDTLSLLDQIIAGSEDEHVRYDRAAALLGFTDQALLDATVDAFADADADATYRAIDGVVQSGQDPRRFVEDLLERLRDLIIARATGPGAGAVLRGMSPDDVDHLVQQSKRFTPAALTGIADLVNETLTELSGVTSPRLHLELLAARVLVASRSTFESTAFDAAGGAPTPVASSAQAAIAQDAVGARPAAAAGPVVAARPAEERAAARSEGGAGSIGARPDAPARAAERPEIASTPPGPRGLGSAPDAGAAPEQASPASRQASASAAPTSTPRADADATAPSGGESDGRPVSDVAAAAAAEWGMPVPGAGSATPGRAGRNASASAGADDLRAAGASNAAGSSVAPGRTDGPVTFARFRDAWPTILGRIRELGGAPAWSVAQSIRPLDYRDDVLLFEVPGRAVLDQFKTSVKGAPAPHEVVREAVRAVLGVTIKFQPRVLNVPEAPQAVRPAGEPQPPRQQSDGPGSAWPDAATPAAAGGAGPTTDAGDGTAGARAETAPDLDAADAEGSDTRSGAQAAAAEAPAGASAADGAMPGEPSTRDAAGRPIDERAGAGAPGSAAPAADDATRRASDAESDAASDGPTRVDTASIDAAVPAPGPAAVDALSNGPGGTGRRAPEDGPSATPAAGAVSGPGEATGPGPSAGPATANAGASDSDRAALAGGSGSSSRSVAPERDPWAPADDESATGTPVSASGADASAAVSDAVAPATASPAGSASDRVPEGPRPAPAARPADAAESSAPAAPARDAAASASAPVVEAGPETASETAPGVESEASSAQVPAPPRPAESSDAGETPARKPVPDLFAAVRSLGAAPVDTEALAREAEERRLAEERAEQAAREAAERASQRTFADGIQRYGEAVVRELLGARFIGEDVIEEEPLSLHPAASGTGGDSAAGYPSDDEAPPADDVPPDYFGAPPPPESEGY